MTQRSSGPISNKLIFWLAIAMIGYAIFDATKERSEKDKNHKTTSEQTQEKAASSRTRTKIQTEPVSSAVSSTNVTAPSENKTSLSSDTQPLPPPPESANGSFLDRMVAKYVAPTIQQSVQGQIDSRLNQLQRGKGQLQKQPNAPRMDLKFFDKTIGQGIAVKKDKIVTFDITLWYLDGLEIMPKRTVTITQGLGQIYIGVEQGLDKMKKGGIRTLIIPSQLMTTRTENVLGSVAFYPEQGVLAEIEVKDIK